MKNKNEIKLFISEEYIEKPNVLLISVDKLKENSYIDLNVDDKKIRVAIQFIQDLIIKDVLGIGLFNTLTDLIENGEVKSAWKDLLDNYIHPIFYYGVVAELAIPLSYKNRNIGTYQIMDDKASGTQLNDIKYLTSYYNNKRDFYISHLQDFLRCNQCFAQFKCPCYKSSSNLNIPLNIKI